ncbi:MAG: hypothetical protein IAG13_13400 [Deltaproteobacteria bacterium]|nr:hypothetical protein [Nannocystaceae bacterium]
MPVAVGALLVVAVLAIIALWPGDEPDKRAAREGATASRSGGAKGGALASAADDGGGGVKARAYDEPSAPGGSGRRNPAVKLPSVGMAPDMPPKDEPPPTFASKADEIAWYEVRLANAQKQLEARKKFVDRLPAARERIENGPDAAKQLEAFEGRTKIVQSNYDRAQTAVGEIELKLKQLRGS